MKIALGRALSASVMVAAAGLASAAGVNGYYRQPTLHGDTVVFVSEGDLWKVGAGGGVATRLTSHPGDEFAPRFSPDGQWIAFAAEYEGPAEVYVMPIAGGQPRRLTWDGGGRGVSVLGWAPARDGKPPRVIASTNALSGLPNTQLTLIDPVTGEREVVPLAQAAQGAYGPDGTLYFTRLAFQGSQTKRYKGGTAQNLWKFDGSHEAVPLTPDFAGTSANPMWWNGRVYFLSDRDGTMELWSSGPDGSNPTQHTNHATPEDRLLDVRGASEDCSGKSGRFVYQFGADLRLFDAATGTETPISITIDSDFDQLREKWIKKPMDYLTAAHVSPDGEKVTMVARGQVFVAPRESGRLVEIPRKSDVRYRGARFSPDGSQLFLLSDESGEVEVWTAPANGTEKPAQVTTGGDVLRWDAVPSPDGKLIALHDKNQAMWVYDVATKASVKIDFNPIDNFTGVSWSPDSRWLAYAVYASNFNRVIRIYDTQDKKTIDATTDRFDTTDAAWSPDGKWLYLLSDRNIETSVGSPWGPLQPEPYFDQKTKVYALALKTGERSPWEAPDELSAAAEKAKAKTKEEPGTKPKPDEPEKPTREPSKETPPKKEPEKHGAASPPPEKPAESDKGESTKSDAPEEKKVSPIVIETEGLATRLIEVPVPAGNYSGLTVNDKRLFFMTSDADPDVAAGGDHKPALQAVDVGWKDVEVKTLAKGIEDYELSSDGKRLMVRTKTGISVIEASSGPNADLGKAAVDLGGWTFALTPREEWRQMFTEAWRLERDYFYDTDMHGVDWKAMLDRYRPLVDRVATRAELSDLIAQMVAELSALHIFVYGGDERDGPDNIPVASLGAALQRDEPAGGYRVTHIYQSDPDLPNKRSPLAAPGVDFREGDVIVAVNGREVLSAPHPNALLRAKAGKQVLVKVKRHGEADREVIVKPISSGAAEDLRYHEWEHTRRMQVEKAGQGQIGYVHLRAMGTENMNEFARGFYPVFNRGGLIIDVRHNRGGNIDSWILSRLMRKAWFYWQPRVGDTTWNMQLAFRGHIVVLCNERTASDGEAFSEGVKRLKLGTVMGTRTWGGEIWLSSSNYLVDGGIATAAETGVFGPEGVWLIEGHGVDPDIVVDNLPHSTFNGEDAQLEAAIQLLQKKLREEPVPPVAPPKHPDKSLKGPVGNSK